MRDFYSLTTQGQVRRFRGLALKALEHYDLEVRRLRLLDASYNCIFRVDTAEGQRYALRICVVQKGKDAQALPLELRWLDALATETGLTVTRPIATREGQWSVEVEHAGVPEARSCVLFSWIPGPDLAERPEPSHWRSFGAFAAALHAHGKAFTLTPEEAQTARTYDRIFPFSDPVVLFEEETSSRFRPRLRELLEQARQQVQAALDTRSDEPLQLIHADLHHWNVKLYRGRICGLDFEDLSLGYPAQDIAITLYYMLDHEKYRGLREAFREGYSACAPWPAASEAEIDTWIAGRLLVLLNLIIQSPRADYQDAVPSFLERCESRLEALLG